jgi:anionic cell wall polymer biosynthesis LytR-Cps2A-Psr (LCP) family protein
MKLFKLVFLVLAVAMLMMASTHSIAMQNSGDQAKQDTAKTQQQNVEGKVSKDGKRFVNDKDQKSWKVDNPDMTKGHENQQVAMVVVVDPDTNEIHIISVEPESQR